MTVSTKIAVPNPAERQDGTGTLVVNGLTVRFGGNTALDDVSLWAGQGEWIGLIGPNGAGKSTLVNCVSGFVHPTAGCVKIDDREITDVRPQARTGLGLGRTFQNLELAGSMSGVDNVALAATGRLSATRRRGWSRACERARLVLADVGFPPHAGDTKVAELPYGLRKLVELARALVTEPKVLVMDEPVAGLGTVDKALFVERLQGVLAPRRTTVLLVEHDMPTVEKLCSRVYVIAAGRSLFDGTFAEVSSHPDVVRAYLG